MLTGLKTRNPSRGPHLNFHISPPHVQPNLHASAAMVPPFPNNVALQYSYFGAPLAPNVQPEGKIAQEGTDTALTLNLTMMYQMFPQFMPPIMPTQNVVQPPPSYLLKGYLGSIHLGLLNINS